MDKLIYLFRDKLNTDTSGIDDPQEHGNTADDADRLNVDLRLEVLMQREFGVSDPRDLTFEQVAHLARIFKAYKMAFEKLRDRARVVNLD